MKTKIEDISNRLNSELKEVGMKISLVPEYRIKYGIYNLIDKGKVSSLLVDEETGDEILCFEDIVGDYSDEPDNNFLEVFLDDKAIDFWSIILAEVFEEEQDFVERTINSMNTARNMGFNYIKFSQH